MVNLVLVDLRNDLHKPQLPAKHRPCLVGTTEETVKTSQDWELTVDVCSTCKVLHVVVAVSEQ